MTTEVQVEAAPDQRLDDRAQDFFKGLGFEGTLPNDLYGIYREFKHNVDRLNPGRDVSLEGFAWCVTLWRRNRKKASK